MGNTKRLKICLLNHGLANGGTDTFVINVAKGLIENGHDVTVVMAVDDDNLQFREQEAIDSGIRIFRTCDLDGLKKKALHCKRLYKLLKNGKFDVFHANMDLLNGLNMFVAKMAGIPVRVCHSHNSESQFEKSTGKHLAVGMYRAVMRKLIKYNSNRYCGCSELAMDYLFPKYWKKNDKATVIFNGIDLDRFKNLGTDLITEKKKSLSLNTDDKVIVVVGRFATQKNPTFIVDIMSELVKLRSDVHLLWIGTGALQKETEERISELNLSDYITLLGSRKDVNEILQCADAFLFPSLFEGLGIVAVEAQAADVICLVSDVVPKMADCGKCIFMSLSDGADRWAEKLNDILKGKIEMQIDKERLHRFDRTQMIEQLEKVYEIN